MTLQILGTMDGRKRGNVVKNERGQFTTIAGRNQTIQQEINEYYKNINRWKKYVDQNPDLKVLIDAEQSKVDAAQSEIRLNNMSRRGINERVKNYRAAMEKQGLKGQALDNQVERYKEGLLAERKKHFNKLKGKKIATQKGKLKGKLKVKPQEEKLGFFGKIGKFFKKNKKTAIAATIVGAGIAGVALLKGCNNTQAPQPVQADTTETDSIPSYTAPTETDSIPGYTAPTKHIVEDGECYDKIAKQALIDRYKESQTAQGKPVDPNYEPSQAEIIALRKVLMERKNAVMDERNWDTKPQLQPGDTLSIAA